MTKPPAAPDSSSPLPDSILSQLSMAEMIVRSPFCKHQEVRILREESEQIMMALPYKACFATRKGEGMHTGVVTALFDTCLGAAVGARLPRIMSMATLDLRIDHIRPCDPQKGLTVRASCTFIEPPIAYVKGEIWHDDPDIPIATAVAAFALSEIDEMTSRYKSRMQESRS